MEIYKDSTKPVMERVEDLLGRMTLEEKAAQLCGDLPMELVQDGMPSVELLKKKFPYGHGRITQYSTMGLADPMKIALLSNTLQKYFVEETRLGIPVALQTENLCGYPAMGGTMFPAQINLSCTWEPELAEAMSSIISEESRAVGINSAMSPVIDIVRDHRWGRVYETYGEDPYLTSQMGIHYIKGMQKDKKNGVACVAKHFLGYSDSQGGLNTAVCRIPDRELYEVFATPFEAAMREADVSSVMANYGEIDGMCVVANRKIAHGLLRDTMKFEGILTSDGAGILKTYKDFKTAETYEEAGLLAKKAGTDTEIPVGNAFRKLPDYVRAGKLDEAILDQSVRRVLKVKFEYGLFENPYIVLDQVKASLTNEEKSALSRDIAAKSLVLLKNEGVLPLKPGTKLAVVGPHSDSLRYPVSGYTYPAYVEMLTAGSEGDEVSIGGMADEAQGSSKKSQDNPFAAFTKGLTKEEKESIGDMNGVLRSMGARTLKEELSDRFFVSYAKGCEINDNDISGIPEAVKAAEDSDVVIMACGGNCGWVNVTGGEGKDRCSLELPGVQQQLLEAVCAVGKPVVLILYGPGIFALPWACEHTAAMIQAWMPGQYAAEVMADALDGTNNFSGKLTTTVPRSVGQTPVTYNHRMGSGYASNTDPMGSLIFTGGYVDQPSQPLFCFGHGLSYTTFALSEFAVESREMATDGTIVVSCAVANTGERQGDEVVQLYYHTKKAHVVRPVKQLAGFKKVSLEPGEKKRVTFRLKTSQLGYYNEEMEFVVEPTVMDIMIGTSAHQIAYTGEITLTGEKVNVMGRRSYTCEADVSAI
ncbi:glycoside hydrolase family 3 N-terminal domain-containing protein [Clostridium sp. MCC353]|uniref:glycoside hydrolase family 3 N-terminal domain-containing protein n=1 Tax=Clostridium sp. MCC353 TaxID=2592646 RepID=UPI001C0145C6|nr:glycoside hydrolase family 3 N-terminal domain-containing protein [Clostridium sp. MCC353]